MDIDNTLNRIILAALTFYNKQGVRKTSMEDVAEKAGVTRVTVYRHFSNKKMLVHAVCMMIADLFQQVTATGPIHSIIEIDERLSRLGLSLYNLPPGDLLGWLEEVSRVYPDVYREFQDTRRLAIDSIFQQALETAAREGILRENLNREVLNAIFRASVVGLLENPALISSHVPMAELFSTVTEVFRFGILKHPHEKANAHE
jgi:AcrR family transcriptional regulator